MATQTHKTHWISTGIAARIAGWTKPTVIKALRSGGIVYRRTPGGRHEIDAESWREYLERSLQGVES